MRKNLLLMCLFLTSTFGFSQVIFEIQEPSPFAGGYNFTYVEADGSWGVPDLTDPANAVTGNLVFAVDGTGDPELACEAITNGAEVAGNIAVVYRGVCEFGLKALNAQNAGAIAVVIVNNQGGDPVGMGPGVNGLSVTVPVVMISQADGMLLEDAIAEGNTMAFIGSKLGMYANDAGSFDRAVLRPEAFAKPAVTAVDDSEFEVNVGAWVWNWGSNDQTDVTLTAEIVFGEDVIYSETSTPVAINSGDSAYFSLPTFSQESYSSGYYNLNYIINLPVDDEAPADNVFEADFMLTDSMYALSRVDPVLQQPIISTVGGSNSAAGFTHCITYRDPNASRLTVKGISFGAATAATSGMTLPEQSFEIIAYEWNDEFEDAMDPNFAFSDLTPVLTNEFYYDEDIPSEVVYASFDDELVLEDDQWYLFCVTLFHTDVYFGYDSKVHYEENFDTYLQPIHPLYTPDNNTWYRDGFASGNVPAFGVRMVSNSVGMEEAENKVRITPFPNPANATVTIPVGNLSGMADLSMFDITGKLVKSETINVSGNGILKVNVADVENGVYVFSLHFENGKSSTFRVVVSK